MHIETPIRTLTEAEVATAQAILDDLDALATRYGVATGGRSLISDWYAKGHIDSWADDFGNVADKRATMAEFINSGHTPSVFGDDHWAEASYYGFQDEVQTAVRELGHYIEDEDIEVGE